MVSEKIKVTSALPRAADVAKAFIPLYYKILQECPEKMYKFYQDGSRLTLAEAGAEGLVDSVKSQLNIHEKLKDLNYRDFQIQIVSIDCQDSLHGGVVVTVTGSLCKKLIAERRFVQSFFLAQQVGGYFVLNDIFRYLDEDKSQRVRGEEIFKSSEKLEGLQAGNHITDTGSRSLESTPIIEELPSSTAAPSGPGTSIQESSEETPKKVVSLLSYEELPSSTAAPSGPGISIQESSEEAPKKVVSPLSYASILRVNTNAESKVPTRTQNASPTLTAVAAEGLASKSSFPTSATTAHPPGRDLLRNVVVPFKVDGRSVHVSNLPSGISTSHLQGAIENFGTIRPDRIIIKGQRECYAFTEVEDRNSAQSANRSSPVSFGSRKLYIDQKRSKMSQRRGPKPGIGHRYSSIQRQDFEREGTIGLGQCQDKDTQFRGSGRGLAPTVSSAACSSKLGERLDCQFSKRLP